MARKTAAVAKEQPALFADTPTAKVETKPKIETKTKEKTDTAPKPAVSKGNLAVVKNTPTNTLAVLVEAMSRKDAANLQIVATLHKEMVAEQSRLDYIEAMRDLKRALPVINKDGKIEYKADAARGKRAATLRFASFENIHEVITPLLDEYGFDLWFSSEPGVAGMMNVIGHLEHKNGYVRQTVLPMPHDGSGGKSGAQGWASAFSFGKRIATIGLLNIRTRAPEDRDVDGATVKRTKGGAPQTIEGGAVVAKTDMPPDDEQVDVCSEDQLIKVREAIEGCGVPEKTFLKHFNIQKVSQLPAADFKDALQACRSYAEKHK